MSNDHVLSNEKITEENKFDLNIFRSSKQRIEMVQDPDCPRDVLDVVITHDMDEEVIMATLFAANLTDELLDKLSEKVNIPREELKAQKENKLLHPSEPMLAGYCAVPWNHVSTNPNGTIRMCCQMINSNNLPGEEAYGTVIKEDSNALSTADDLSKHRNAPAWKKIRQQMLAGEKPAICQLCWDEEENGIGSRRDWTNIAFNDVYHKAITKTESDGSIKHEDFPIMHWDLRFGNKCNLACRSCGPTDSDLWYRDWVALKDNTFNNRGFGDVTISVDDTGKHYIKDSPFEWYEKTDLVSNIKQGLSQVKRFYFTGGEPTINHTHRELLQYCIDHDYAKDIILDYNTNMAGVPNAIFKQWSKFKEVNLGMSIDGIYEHFEYIRYPGKWSTAYKNLQRIDTDESLSNVKASITMTVSIYNVLHFLDMQWWVKEQNWNRIDHNIIVHNLYGPRHLNTQNLSSDMKRYITERYTKFMDDTKERWPTENEWLWKLDTRTNSILTHMNDKEQNVQDYNEFVKQSEALDKVRGENWKKSCPEVYQMIQHCEGKALRDDGIPEWKRQIRDNKYFCILPFNHMYVGTDSRVNACCVANFNVPLEKDLTGKTFEDIWTSKNYVDFRKDMLAGKRVERCENCYKIDEAGGGSDRQTHNSFFKSPRDDWDISIYTGNTDGTPTWVDVRPGRFCNLGCRMCFVGVSSTVADEHKAHPELVDVTGETWYPLEDWIENETMYASLQRMIPKLKSIKIAGGESLFMPGIIKLVRWCVESGNTHLRLDITTNGTCNKGKILTWMEKFKRIDFQFSIDGIGAVNDYIRWPSQWDTIDTTYKLYCNMDAVETVNMLATVQAYNAFDLVNVIKYWKDRGSRDILVFNFVNWPRELSIDILPLEDRIIIADLIEAEVSELAEAQRQQCRIDALLVKLRKENTSDDLDDLRTRWADRTIKYDSIRNQSISDVHPKLAQYVEEWKTKTIK